MLDHKLLIKNLTSRNLELKYKVYGDSAVNDVGYSEEEKYSCSMKIVGVPGMSSNTRHTEIPQTLRNGPFRYPSEINTEPMIRRQTERIDMKKEVADYLYNEITSKRLEEFHVVKINRHGKKQNRVLGIDGYNIYNDKVPGRQKGQNFKVLKSIFKKSETKRSSRPLDSIKSVKRLSEKKIIITFKDSKKSKDITYE